MRARVRARVRVRVRARVRVRVRVRVRARVRVCLTCSATLGQPAPSIGCLVCGQIGFAPRALGDVSREM